MPPKKGPEPIDVTRFAREEIIKVIKSECKDFELIPECCQWTMALYASGAESEQIAGKTGRTEKQVAADIEKYKGYVSILSDCTRARLGGRALWASVPNWIDVLTDVAKIKEANVWTAMRALRELPEIMRELMALEEDMAKHEKEMRKLDFSQFGKSLGTGEG